MIDKNTDVLGQKLAPMSLFSPYKSNIDWHGIGLRPSVLKGRRYRLNVGMIPEGISFTRSN